MYKRRHLATSMKRVRRAHFTEQQFQTDQTVLIGPTSGWPTIHPGTSFTFNDPTSGEYA